jgi:hypothetical protein
MAAVAELCELAFRQVPEWSGLLNGCFKEQAIDRLWPKAETRALGTEWLVKLREDKSISTVNQADSSAMIFPSEFRCSTYRLETPQCKVATHNPFADLKSLLKKS